jgi:hypothetical protein
MRLQQPQWACYVAVVVAVVVVVVAAVAVAVVVVVVVAAAAADVAVVAAIIYDPSCTLPLDPVSLEAARFAPDEACTRLAE